MRRIIFYTLLCIIPVKSDKRLQLSDPDEFQSIVNRLELEFLQIKAQQSASQNEVIQLQSQLQGAKQELQSTKQELKKVKTQQANSQNDVTMLTSRLQSAQQELSGVNSQIKSLQQENVQLNAKSTGTTYIRWGKRDCPAGKGTYLVYSGLVGGSSFSGTGGAIDYLCLPRNPRFISSGFALQCPGCVNSLYGGVYQFGYNRIKLGDDAPCAVCHVKSQTTILVPASNNCPLGWKEEYNGLLSGNYDLHPNAGQFVCLDNEPEYINNTQFDYAGSKSFYPVRTVCGSLPCPPYEEGKFLPCVICSK